MSTRHRLIVAIALVSFAGTSAATAQAPAATPASQWCAGINDDDASSRMEALWRSRWLQIGANWYTAYEIKPKPRNPFDKAAPQDAPHAPVTGFVWVHAIQCELGPGVRPDEITARVRAHVASFAEQGRWARPVKTVLLMDVTLGRATEAKRLLIDQSAETGILMPDMVFRVPALSELPKRSRTLGLPCLERQKWTGKRCAS